VAALYQVDNDQAGKGQPDIGMDGIADVEELQGPECRGGEDQEAEVHEPARPGTPHGPRSRRPSGNQFIVHRFSIAFKPQQVRARCAGADGVVLVLMAARSLPWPSAPNVRRHVGPGGAVGEPGY
jgi:hypothetical protein